MGKPLLMRFARVLRSSLFRRQNFLILAAPATDAPGPTAPLGSILLRVNSRSDEAHCAQAEKAMLDAGEPPALTAPRLVHGDEFFGWLVDSHVVSFGWVSYRERVVGCQRLRDTAGRAFLYNFHTIMAFRGHGLYAALLLAIRHVLSNEGAVEFIIDAEKRNRVSLNGIGAAGFAMVAQAGFGLLFNHWRWPHWRSVVTTTHRDLFSE